MHTSEKTYTFRAQADLGPRVREAFEKWQRIFASENADEDASQAMQTFFVAWFRRVRAMDDLNNQSALLRTAFETFVLAAEKATDDLEYVDAYEDWASEDHEAPRVRRGALSAAADRWRDE
jgi:hypothetical protein